jgi:hypothetical protein
LDGIAVTAPTVTDYAVNHQFGGELSSYIGYHQSGATGVHPARTIYADSGTQPGNARHNPPATLAVEAGAWMLDVKVGVARTA